MDIPVNPDKSRFSRFIGSVSLDNSKFVLNIFIGLIALQAVGFLLLGTGRSGRSVSGILLSAHNVLALICAWKAFHRAHRVAAMFWVLHGLSLLTLLIPTVVGTYDTLFHRATLSASTWRVLFCLYGAPVLMMLFLPETDRDRRKSEIFLDLFQVAIVVGLSFSTFFLLPVQQMLPEDALLRYANLSNLQSSFMLAAVMLRFIFARVSGTRSLFLRVAIFLAVCAIVTYIGNWIDLQNYTSLSAWFDLGWALPYIAGGLVAVSWNPPASEPVFQPATGFLSLFGINVVLVVVLFCCIDLLMGRWKAAHSETLTAVAVGASLLAFSVRLALTQYQQHREIAERKAAQEALFDASAKVSSLLVIADLELTGITQISELGNLLQACSSREEALRIIPERLAGVFPDTSGSLSLINASKDRVESAAQWGEFRADEQAFAPDDCWSLRRGCMHTLPAPRTSLRCSHLQVIGPSVCIPLVASGDALGVLSIQDDARFFDVSRPSGPDALARRNQLASAVAKHIALAICNLNLRETLRLQAIRDPLTGLYNRRYMQEFLEREILRARRRARPLAVMMLDIDNFKRYNDSFGHPAGDEALRFVSEALLRAVRGEDLACRYGGEEFCLIFPECSLQQATVRAEEIRSRMKELHLVRGTETCSAVTVSIGVAGFAETTDNNNLLLKFADDALYQAKREGRDRVVVARPDSKSW